MMEAEKYPYQKAWKRYGFLIRLLFAMFPLTLLPFVLLSSLNSEIAKGVLAFVGIFFSLILAAVNFRIMFWRCPRCRNFYFPWWQRTQMLFAKECKYCGLKKYEGSKVESFYLPKIFRKLGNYVERFRRSVFEVK